MNKQETVKLLALIKVAFPTSYRDMDDATKKATVNMWASSFPEVPYQLMEQAFNHYRMRNKFPPTVAEMVEELGHIYYQALECANIHKNLGNEAELNHFRAIMACTSRYKDPENLVSLQAMPTRLEGGIYGENGSTHPGLHSGAESWNELR